MASDWMALRLLMEVEETERNRPPSISINPAIKIDPFDVSERHFIRLFRLNKDVAKQLIESLRPFLPEQRRRSALSVQTRVLAALRFFASGSYQLNIGQDVICHMSQQSVSRCITSVARAMSTHLLAKWVTYPMSPEALDKIKRRFHEEFGFPGVIGAIDCTHVCIVAPPTEDPIYPEHIYVNRKGSHSINVQLVCDADMIILNVNACFPGSTHDAHIWRCSALHMALQQMYELSRTKSHWLLGDSGYPLQPWLMTPIVKEEMSPAEQSYNKLHAKTRNIIERCIGLLKARWRCLLKHRVLHYHPETATQIINSCVVLHNICVLNKVELLEDVHHHVDPEDNDAEAHDSIGNAASSEGKAVQQRLVRRCFHSFVK